MKETNDMLYIVDHHNSFTTCMHTTHVSSDDLLVLIQGLRFYQNVYINYEVDDDLFKDDAKSCPSWSNQDCQVFYYGKDERWYRYEDRRPWPRWVALDEKPNLYEPDFSGKPDDNRWHWHDIG